MNRCPRAPIAPLAALLLTALTACTRVLPAPAVPLELVPAEARTGPAPLALRLLGDHFPVRLQADFDHPEQSEVDAAYALALTAPSGEPVPLAEVTRRSATELSATLPEGTPPGVYDLSVTDPWGRTVVLPTALTLTAECTTAAECDDARACTTDTCQTFRCQHALDAGNCLISGACVAAGATSPASGCQRCDPARSTTAWSQAPEQSACDDGDACTTGERCTAGVCGAATGRAVNGTPCDDHDLCTRGETCQSGVCGAPLSTVTCPAQLCREAGTCDPRTGACARADRPDETPCTVGLVCATGERCVAGECRPRGNGGCANTPPRACLEVSPSLTGASTDVVLDASCSFDLEDPMAGLTFRFRSDGAMPLTGRSNDRTRGELRYPAPGVYTATVEVRDSGGLVASASRRVSVAAPAEELLVTTAADEEDPGATPAAPGGTGLSLREAILLANAAPSASVIRFLAPALYRLRNLPELTAPGARIVGSPGVELEFSLSTPGTSCLHLSGTNQQLTGITASRCVDLLLHLTGAGSEATDLTLTAGTSTGTGVLLGRGAQLGPRVDVSGFTAEGVVMIGDDSTVDGCRIHHNGAAGIRVKRRADRPVIQRSELFANGGPGVTFESGGPAIYPVLRHNTIDGNGGAGIAADSNSASVSARDNLLTHNGAGLCGGSFTAVDPSGFFENEELTCAGTLAPGSTSVSGDPQYLGRAVGDFRLGPESHARDAAVDLGLDLNGSLDGRWSGPAPDLGANESPY